MGDDDGGGPLKIPAQGGEDLLPLFREGGGDGAPESVTPRSPTTVSYPWEKRRISPSTQAVTAAARISSALAPQMPMFSSMDRENRKGS